MTGAPHYLVDTNVLLRFFVGDDPAKARAAKTLVEQARTGKVVLEIPFITVSETVHTLRTFYGVERSMIARELLSFLKSTGIKLSFSAWLYEALDEYARRNVSFGDACIEAEARSRGIVIASFDRDFDGLEGVERYEPK